MAVNIHAVLLLLLPVGTAAALALARKSGGKRVDPARALLFGLVLAAVAIIANQHMCLEGTPRQQPVIGAMCLFALLALAGSRKLAVCGGVIIAAVTIGLSFHFADLVHESDWTGNPNFPDVGPTFVLAQQTYIRSEVADHPEVDVPHPAGWLRDSDLAAFLDSSGGIKALPARDTRRVWHSSFTGLYRVHPIPRDVWYAGGKPSEAMLELRPRLHNQTTTPSPASQPTSAPTQ